jgi:hypothetical protein
LLLSCPLLGGALCGTVGLGGLGRRGHQFGFTLEREYIFFLNTHTHTQNEYYVHAKESERQAKTSDKISRRIKIHGESVCA